MAELEAEAHTAVLDLIPNIGFPLETNYSSHRLFSKCLLNAYYVPGTCYSLGIKERCPPTP